MKMKLFKYDFIIVFVLATFLNANTNDNQSTKTASALQQFEDMVSLFWKFISEPLFNINDTTISIIKILFTLSIFIFGFLLGKFYKANIEKISQNNTLINTSTRTILSNIGYYIILIITFFIAMNLLGINLSSIALVAGALSVGIGFGLQNIVSNFISGIILMFERTIKVGDYVELSSDTRGKVREIRMRSITITTNSNIDIIVPNQYFIENNVINWTMNDKIRRFQISFGVAYGTDPQKVITIIKEAVEKSNFEDVVNTPERNTKVIMTGLGDNSIDFELFVWIQGRDILYPKSTTSRFLVLIYNTLNENNIEIPFPQQDIHIRSMDTSIFQNLKNEV